MKKILYILILVLFPLLSIGQTWKINPAGTKISFVIKNAGFSVDGSFSGLSGEIIFDPKELPKSSFNTSIDAASINTGINKRNEHLKKDEYFDVAKYPKISFKTK